MKSEIVVNDYSTVSDYKVRKRRTDEPGKDVWLGNYQLWTPMEDRL